MNDDWFYLIIRQHSLVMEKSSLIYKYIRLK